MVGYFMKVGVVEVDRFSCAYAFMEEGDDYECCFLWRAAF